MLGIMAPHYTLVEPICCSGSDLARHAFGVALVEREVMVVVSKWWRQKSGKRVVLGPPTLMRCILLRLLLSIGLKWMSGWLGLILRCEGPMRRCGLGRMSKGAPRRYGGHLVGVVVCLRCPFHPLLIWPRSMRPPLVYVMEFFNDSLSPLIYIFKSE